IELSLDCVILGENHEHARKRWITVGELLAYLIAERRAFDLFGGTVKFQRGRNHSLCLAAPGFHSEPPKAFQTERLAVHTVAHGPCYFRDLVLFHFSLGPLPPLLNTVLRLPVVVNS